MTNSRNELKVGELNQIIWFRIIAALENKYQIGDEMSQIIWRKISGPKVKTFSLLPAIVSNCIYCANIYIYEMHFGCLYLLENNANALKFIK